MVKSTFGHTSQESSLPAKKNRPSPKTTKQPKHSSASGQPVFGQPQQTPDPTSFKTPHPSDDSLYAKVNNKLVQPIPAARGGAVEPILTLAQVYGPQGAAKVKAIKKDKQIVFHSVGDTGSVKGPSTESEVADKMVSDFQESNAADVPS